ncbi:beta-ketoacyl-[acyl-carrier-protein] synthase family protein [Thiotrichales bacterium 19S9-12]|nr:beta-ketoacyl-[acyl-carrier-protein] synthase family protein [Thiotrichales bacterium 19S9-11]MCF6810974.1 beta-ketoacyl-[acyl-carrier-protein] synthase family protein [Thiotrichales bacterium 19S9-12]
MQVYLNELGIICALGDSKDQVVKNLLNNKQTNVIIYDHLFSGRKTYIAEAPYELIKLDQSLKAYDCRNNRLLISAYEQIKSSVDKLKNKYGKNRIGIILGTSTSGIYEGELAYKAYKASGVFPDDFDYRQQELGQIAQFLSEYTDIKGPCYSISTACSSSAKAVIAGYRLIANNLCDAVIVGGCDSLCQMTLNGFDALESVSDSICNPFSQNRNGITIGEGAGLFLLSKEPSEIEFLAGGESSDGYHITSPEPGGLGARLSMSHALSKAGLTTSDIGYINAHGTATIKNDQMESKAIYDLFEDKVPITSTKPLTGHTLGAAAAIELGLLWLLLSDQYNPKKILLPQIWDQQKGDDISNCFILSEEKTYDSPYFMSNSFAFGGNNASLIIVKTK